MALPKFCEIYYLPNLVKAPTCYKNPSRTTSIDLILTNFPKSFQHTQTIETGLSDFSDFDEQMKQLNITIKQRQLLESEQTDQIKWELLKCETRKFAIIYPKKSHKTLEFNVNSEANFDEYAKCKNDLELIYERIAEVVKIRSKWRSYEEGEKSAKFFLNLENKNPLKLW